MFSYKDLRKATRGFSQAEKLGGSFYRGLLRDQGLQVAIKRVFLSSMQEVGRQKLIAEVCIRSQLRHGNIAQLIGWSHDHKANELLVVYELVTNGSLQDYIYGSGSILTWPIRYQIILGVDDALHYLHKGGSVAIVHGNINSSSVMLDSSFNAKLGDFGLAACLRGSSELNSTVRLASSVCHTPPEVFHTSRFTTESDVYSFGVVLLEVASGRPPIFHWEHGDMTNLVHWVWELYGRGALLDAANSRLDGEFDADEMERVLIVGLWCAHSDYRVRPSIQEAMDVLRKLQDPPPHLELPPFTWPLLDCTTSDDER